MGSVKAKPVRQTPVRYVAKQLPRNDVVPIEQQFKKPIFSTQGINMRRDNVKTEPMMYVETAKEAGSTEITDHVAPRWYLNTFMEMTDNIREDQCVISGNLPHSWFRDKYEPYSLVRGRIDDEDLRWVLAPEQRQKNINELVEFTKLERGALQDILDTVELPRRQYRNYKGKLHKAVDDVNTHMTARKTQLDRAREAELLREIGYTEEEVAKDQQYLTNRPRGLKTLDDLGVSVRERERLQRANETDDLEQMLNERRIAAIEHGEVLIDKQKALEHNENDGIFTERFFPRVKAYKSVYKADINRDKVNYSKLQWWLERSRRITRAVDVIHNVPVYNERLSSSEEQLHSEMNEAAKLNFELNRIQGAKGFADPRGNFDELLDALRTDKLTNSSDSESTHVEEDEILDNDIYRFPHTKDHGKKPVQSPLTDRRDRLEVVDIDEDREQFGEFVPRLTNNTQSASPHISQLTSTTTTTTATTTFSSSPASSVLRTSTMPSNSLDVKKEPNKPDGESEEK